MSTPQRTTTALALAALLASPTLAAQTAPAGPVTLESQARQLQRMEALLERQDTLVQSQSQEIGELRQRLSQLESQLASSRDATPAAPAQAVQAPAPATATTAPVAPDKHGTSIDWKNGVPQFSSDDGAFSFRPRGRIQADFSGTDGSRHADRNIAGTELRRARLGFQGTLSHSGFYVVEADFADNNAILAAATLGYNFDWGGRKAMLSAGYGRMERGMDGASNDLYTPFTERSAIFDALMNASGSLATGVQGSVAGRSWQARAELVGDGLDGDGSNSDNLALVWRAHWNPVKRDDLIVHLGTSGYYEKIGGHRPLSMSWRIAGHFNDNLRAIAAPIADPEGSRNANLELGAILGSAWVMGETGRRDIRVDDGPDVTHKASTISAGWMFGGASVPYAPSNGQWTAMQVRDPVGAGGHGEFGLAGRWERVDYTDQPGGGRSDVYTLGLNWYLTRQVRLLLDLSHWRLDNASGAYLGRDSGEAVNTRLQLAF